MKNLIVFLVAVVVLFAVVGVIGGWIDFYKDEDSATIDVDTQEMRDDIQDVTDTTIDAGRDLLDGNDLDSNDLEDGTAPDTSESFSEPPSDAHQDAIPPTQTPPVESGPADPDRSAVPGAPPPTEPQIDPQARGASTEDRI